MLPPGVPHLHPVILLLTWFGCGRSPWAPGTVGSLGALPFAALLLWLGGPWALAVGAAAATGLGLWACQWALARGAAGDPGWIVIDEIAGQWLALLPAASLDWRLFLAGFALFRLFDIVKPWPASWADKRLGGAPGIMLDDLFAGAYAALTLFTALRAFHWL